MKIKDFKILIESIPQEFDDYELVFSEIEDSDENTYKRTDDLLVGMVSDDENKKMCLMGEYSYNLAVSFYEDNKK